MLRSPHHHKYHHDERSIGAAPRTSLVLLHVSEFNQSVVLAPPHPPPTNTPRAAVRTASVRWRRGRRGGGDGPVERDLDAVRRPEIDEAAGGEVGLGHPARMQAPAEAGERHVEEAVGRGHPVDRAARSMPSAAFAQRAWRKSRRSKRRQGAADSASAVTPRGKWRATKSGSRRPRSAARRAPASDSPAPARARPSPPRAPRARRSKADPTWPWTSSAPARNARAA